MSRKPETPGPYVSDEPYALPIVKPTTVRALRPHDTFWGMKNTGDEYERSEVDAKALEKAGIVAIVNGAAA